jgi:hypothetical protein
LTDSVALRVPSALARAAEFLLSNQDAAGTWRDFSLPPGRSDAWITAYVGYALLHASMCVHIKDTAFKSAVAALVRERRPEGWGYNRNVACDADSTSWALRFQAGIAGPRREESASLLLPFIADTGGVRTFDYMHLGSWAAENAEVTAVAGLSLGENAEIPLALQLRKWLLRSWTEEGWQPFWWRCQAYVRAQAVEFLRLSGGIPGHIANVERARTLEDSSNRTDFEESQILMFAVQMRIRDEAERRVAQLLKVQCEDGGWHTSVDLRVPQQKAPHLADLYGDDRRLFTTASALRAICMWYLSTGKTTEPPAAGNRSQRPRHHPLEISVQDDHRARVRGRQTNICKRVAERLRASDLWISDVEFRQQGIEQGIFGHCLLRDIFRHFNDSSNCGLIFAESIFGYEDYRFEKQVERLLAFGGTLGEGLSFFVGLSERANRRAQELCALLNFGASIIDLLVDDNDVDRGIVLELFGCGQLKKLVTDPTNIQRLNAAIQRLKSASQESRLVLTTFSNLFALLHQYRCNSSDLEAVGDLFTEAYEAELRTVKSPRVPSDVTLKSSAISKSVLVFRVMLQLACACEGPVKPSSVEMADALSTQIGSLFALVDDFADLTRDAETGSVNGILLELDENSIGFNEWESRGYRALIDRFEEALCHHLARICRQLEERAEEERQLAVFRTRLLFYVRSWLE